EPHGKTRVQPAQRPLQHPPFEHLQYGCPAVTMIEVLDADDVQSEVPELFHHSPELRVVSHRRDDTRFTTLSRRRGLSVIARARQPPSSCAPNDDPVLPGIASQSDHETPMLQAGAGCGRLSGPRLMGGNEARAAPAREHRVWGETRTDPPGRHRP